MITALSAFSAPSAESIDADVIATSTEDHDGLFVTTIHAIDEDGTEHTFTIPGGELDGIVQRVGDFEVPRAGDRIVLEAR